MSGTVPDLPNAVQDMHLWPMACIPPPLGETPTVGSAVRLFCSVLGGSLALGVTVGIVAAVLTRHIKVIKEQPHFEVALMWLFAYGSYVTANAAELSGIVSLFFCAIVLSHYTKYNISHNSRSVPPRPAHCLITDFSDDDPAVATLHHVPCTMCPAPCALHHVPCTMPCTAPCPALHRISERAQPG